MKKSEIKKTPIEVARIISLGCGQIKCQHCGKAPLYVDENNIYPKNENIKFEENDWFYVPCDMCGQPTFLHYPTLFKKYTYYLEDD